MDMNNEMDELFRKAGEDYPLNLGKPDWDAVAGKLQTDTGDLGPGFGLAAAAPRKRRRYLWLLLLLLPAGIYGLILTQKSSPGTVQKGNGEAVNRGSGNGTADKDNGATPADQGISEKDKTEQNHSAATAAAAGNTNPPTNTGGADARATEDKAPLATETKHSALAAGETQAQAETGRHKPVTTGKGPVAADPVSASFAKKRSGSVAGSDINGAHQPAGANSESSQGKLTQTGPEKPVSDETAKPVSADNHSGTAGLTQNQTTAAAAGMAGDEAAAPENNGNGSPLADAVMTSKANETGKPDAKKPAADPVAANTAAQDSAAGKKSVVHPSVKQVRGFYAGITAAPDFSTVKFQTMKSTGYSFGVVAGYRLNPHLSIETGLSWDRKKYYSKGEYFDKSKTSIPSTVKVTYLDGYCDMFEIPLTLRYDISTGRKGNWFAAAGFSSYLMKNENYLYGAEANNVSWSRYVDYKNSGNNFFSILQFSAGYEYNWSARNRIRIEPYFKAPISGVGIGSLPISSLGMTFGFVHSFR